MRVIVATHGHCFDGLASAVVFSALVRTEHPTAEFKYRACGYGDAQLSPSDKVLTGDQNAILDYRFFASERLTWYFDHHRTAFATEADRKFFDDRAAGGKYFFDASYTSCTKLIAEVAQTRFGLELTGLSELIRWADIIDAAAFESAAQALDRSNPVMRLAAVIERHADDSLLTKLVGELSQQSLDVVSNSDLVTRKYAKLAEQHDRFVRRVQESTERIGRVVFVDMTSEPLESVGKFVTYGLYPDAVYSVIVGLMKNGIKISVGYNPWSGTPRDVDISSICARYGGGGHAVVGAVQLKTTETVKAKEIARKIVEELEG